MKEIHLDRVLVENRHKRGITQEELAAHLGVSKAAVSKWETAAAYPDITLLPRLASYFNIRIDELMGYTPQMNGKEILELHRRLAGEFSSLPFEEALGHCREVAKQYFACFPLLFQIGSLLVNHSMLAGSPERSRQVLEEARTLFARVKKETERPALGKEALLMEAYCLLALHRPAEALELLGTGEPVTGSEPLLASAYQMTGNIPEAKRVLQAGIYKRVLSLFDLLSSYMPVCRDDPAGFEQTCRRYRAVAEAFHLDALHPGVLLSGYLAMAQGWAALQEPEKALQNLEEYTALATSGIYPLKLHGDSYFHLLDGWFDKAASLGEYPPREESVIRRSMTQALADNPAFAGLAGNPRFRSLTARLKSNEERD